MGHYFILALIVWGCVTAAAHPAIGCVLFYFITLLDPLWNWRWALPADAGLQKWIFVAIAIGAFLNSGRATWPTGPARWAVVCLASFLGLAWLSLQQSMYPGAGAFYFSVMWKVVLLSAMSIWLITTRKHLAMLLFACVIGAAYNAYQINVDYLNFGFCRWVYRFWGSNGLDNNTYALMTLPVMAIGLGCGIGYRKWYLSYGCFFAVALQAHQLMLVESRGAMLATILMGGILLAFMPRSTRNLRLAALGVVSVVVLAGPPVVKEFMSSFEKGEELDSSASSRYLLWNAGARIIADYPLTGVGPYASRFYVPEYYEGGLNRTKKALHNLFFEVAAETGIPGLLCYLGYFIVPYYAVFRNRKRYLQSGSVEIAATLAVLCGIPAYFLGSMFSAGTLIESCYLLPVIACVLLRLDSEGTLGDPHEEALWEDEPAYWESADEARSHAPVGAI